MTSSAIYEGWVAHRRLGAVPHLSATASSCRCRSRRAPRRPRPDPLWSARRAAPAHFRESDHLPGGEGPLSERARDLVEARLGRRPGGPVRLLANPRYFGVGFQPGVFPLPPRRGERTRQRDRRGRQHSMARADGVRAGRAEGRLRAHVRGTFRKRMHVSPFQPMEQRTSSPSLGRTRDSPS